MGSPADTARARRIVERLYSPENVRSIDYDRDLADPGEFPYTRGIHATGYRGKLWTMRQFAGFGTPEETNERYRRLLGAGGTGLSVAFDLPTLMGRDPDHELALGEVGKCGVNVTSLADMEVLFAGIDLGAITTSMTINGPASMIFAMYLALAEQRGTDWKTLSGTIQNDILKEFIAQKEFIYPPGPSMRLVTDVFAFCTEHVPRWRRSWRSRCATALSTCSTASTRAWTWTRSRRASPSSSTRTTISLKRLPSSAPRAGSGHG
jgi:methylmalonyl-CoA mutase N-terminal domain/subunit